uniref:UDP-glycosyltransferases domain-containing protein n=1 Tax=Fagus sylvatica TaxID=28930 RepID=A0A2N9G0R2_FAGSY
MDFSSAEPPTVCHVVAMPFPGRGHINPMMNLCKLLSSKRHDFIITLVVTEEWLGYIGSDPKPNNIRFASIPNVVPPERLKAVDFPGFYEATMTKMEAPFEQLLDRLEPPVDAILDNSSITTSHNDPNYLQWLDSQSTGSILYISLGSFLSVSGAQMDEIVVGLRNSDVRFLWVARGEASRLKESCGDMGLVVPWCDQLKVLCHPSIGGFWTHCGWNSTLESIFAGIPMLTFPLFLDQLPISRLIVEDWKIGWRVKRSKVGSEMFVTKEEISELVQRFMSVESGESKELRERARGLKDICRQAIIEGGSSYTNLDAFVESIALSHNH